MKTIIILCALVAVVVCRPEDTTYSSQYDNFDANELASNSRLLKNYAKCFLGQGPCTAEGSDFKKVIPDALKTKCVKCSSKQKELIRIVVKAMQEKQPDLWKQLVKQEDPDAKYTKEFEEFINGSD